MWAADETGSAPGAEASAAAPGVASPAALVLGHALKASRRSRGLTREAVAHALGPRQGRAVVTRIEGALTTRPAERLAEVLTGYGIDDPVLQGTLRALADAAADDVQALFRDAWPGWPERLRACLRAATRVRSYDGVRIPRPLWTASYAELCRRLAARHRLASAPEAFAVPAVPSSGQQVEAVIDELVLWQDLDRHVMCEQIDHLSTLIEQGQLTLGIIPRDTPRLPYPRVAEMTGPRYWLAAEEDPTGTGVHYSGPARRATVAREIDHIIARGGPPAQALGLLQEARRRYAARGPLPAPY